MTTPTTRRTILITVAVVVVAGLAVGGYLLGRSTSAGPDPSPVLTATAASQDNSSPSPSYQPTDEYGSPEPAIPTGDAEAGAGGTTTGPAGLPLGYSHDQTGAVNAATNYLMWMNSLKITNKTDADAMAKAAAADIETEQALIASFDAIRPGMSDLIADQPEPARGAYAVADYGDDHALIYIWSPEVATDTTDQTKHLWGINALTVAWANGDWKIKNELVTQVGGAAVDPADPTGNPSAEEKHSILARTPADPGEITDSADQSWFEYANAPR